MTTDDTYTTAKQAFLTADGQVALSELTAAAVRNDVKPEVVAGLRAQVVTSLRERMKTFVGVPDITAVKKAVVDSLTEMAESNYEHMKCGPFVMPVEKAPAYLPPAKARAEAEKVVQAIWGPLMADPDDVTVLTYKPREDLKALEAKPKWTGSLPQYKWDMDLGAWKDSNGNVVTSIVTSIVRETIEPSVKAESAVAKYQVAKNSLLTNSERYNPITDGPCGCAACKVVEVRASEMVFKLQDKVLLTEKDLKPEPELKPHAFVMVMDSKTWGKRVCVECGRGEIDRVHNRLPDEPVEKGYLTAPKVEVPEVPEGDDVKLTEQDIRDSKMSSFMPLIVDRFRYESLRVLNPGEVFALGAPVPFADVAKVAAFKNDLTSLREKAMRVDIERDDQFTALVREAVNLVGLKVMGTVIDTSYPTMLRWATGSAVPMMGMRGMVRRFIVESIDKGDFKGPRTEEDKAYEAELANYKGYNPFRGG